MKNTKNSGIMNSKKGNAAYICFIIGIFAVVFIFLIAVAVRKNKNQSLDYDQVLDMGEDNYIIKISEAAYITDKKEMSFILYFRLPDNLNRAAGSKPYIQSCTVYFQKGGSEDYAEKIKSKDINDITKVMSAEDIEDKIKYVELLVTSKREAYYDSDTVDEFGHIIKGQKHEGSEEIQMIRIDGADITHLSEAEYEKKVEKAADISLENLQLKDNEESSSPETSAVTETTAPVTAEPVQTTVPPQTTAPVQTTIPPQKATAKDTKKDKSSTKKSKKKAAKKKAVKVKGIMLITGFKDNKVKLPKGKDRVLKASIIPGNSTNKKVSWKSSNSKIVKVSKNGKIAGVGKGAAYITVTTKDGAFTATCKVTVTEKK